MSSPTRSAPGFRPGWLPTLAMLAAVALLCGLGTWQVRRHQWRQADLEEKRDRVELPPRPLDEALDDRQPALWRRVRARGRYDHERAIVVAHVPRGTADGVRILTPFRARLQGGEARWIVVDRGWAPLRAAAEARTRGPLGEVAVTGLFFPLRMAVSEPGAAEEVRLRWTRFDPANPAHAARLQAQLPYRLTPALVQRGPGATEAGAERWPEGGFAEPTSPVDHVQYAITWYSIAVAAVGTWVGWGVVQGRRPRDAAADEGGGSRS